MATRVVTNKHSAQTRLAYLLRWEWMLVALIIAVSAVNTWLSPFFLQPANLFRTSSDFVVWGLMMLPMVFIIISGNIDLSVASILGMSASLMGWLFLHGWNIWPAAGAALILGALAGLLNGVLIARLRLPALIVTLGTFAFYRGMGFALLGDTAARGYPQSFTYMGQGNLPGTLVPFALVPFLGLALILGLLLHATTFGRLVYAIGNNEEACRYTGVAVERIKVVIFVLSGLTAALAGILMSARFGSTRPDIGLGTELDVITATVLGGVDIFGGSGTMVGAVLSLCLIGLTRFGMGLLNIQGQVQGMIIGLLLILVILLPQIGGRLVQRRLRLDARTLVVIAGAAVVVVLFVSFVFWSRAQFLSRP